MNRSESNAGEHFDFPAVGAAASFDREFHDAADATVSRIDETDADGQTFDELELLARALQRPAASNPFLDEPGLLRSLERASGVFGSALLETDQPPSPLDPAQPAPARHFPSKLGPYQLLEPIGQGGMGSVWKALHPALDRIVAIKLLAPDRLANREMAERFRREMRAIGRIDHPHIVRALDAGEADGVQYLAMEYVSGIDLSALLKKVGRLPVAEACAIAQQAALGLHAAHARGLVHRDVKPANLMLCSQEFSPAIVKVMDLGIASVAQETNGVNEATDMRSALTADGQIVGTLEYMAPEQADGHQTVDARADVWSLGATLYTLLTGGTVYVGRPATSVLQKLSLLANEPVPPVKSRRPDLPDSLARVIDRMLDRKPEARFASMADVAAALQPFAAGADLGALLKPASDVPFSAIPAPEAIANPQASDGRRLRVRGGWVTAALAAFAALAALVVAVRTRDGEVLVEIPDDVPAAVAKQIQVEVRGDGEVRVADAERGWTVGIREGKYDVRLTGGGDQFDIRENTVTVSRDKRAIVRITRKPAVVADAPAARSQPLAPKPGEATGTKPIASGSGYAWPKDAPPPAIAPFDAAQARRHQEAWAKHLDLPVEYTNSVGMKFVLIPPGEYQRGSTTEEIEKLISDNKIEDARTIAWLRSETPRHTVVLTRPFYLGLHETTQKQYSTVIGKNPSIYVVGNADLAELLRGLDTTNFPVEALNWRDASAFCLALGQREGIEPKDLSPEQTKKRIVGTDGYRLPTEAEWEFACRAGTSAPSWCGAGDSDLAESEWISKNASGRPHEVGTLRANPFGLFDMLGNVREFTRDRDDWEGVENWYQQYLKTPAIDPEGRPAGVHCVSKGSDVNSGDWQVRASLRDIITDYGRIDRRGFRVALSVDAVRRLRASKPADPSSNRSPLDKETADANRRAAEWLLTLGEGTSFQVTTADGVIHPLTSKSKLPEDPFRLNHANVLWNGAERPLAALVPTLADRLRGARLSDFAVRCEALTADEFAEIVVLPELADAEAFALTASAIDDRMLASLARLPRLRVIDLHGATAVTGKGLGALKASERLTGLSLLFSNLTATDLDALRSLPALTYLNLDGTPCKAEHIDALLKLKLTALVLHNTGFDDAMAARISGMTGLEHLNLQSNPLTDKGLKELKSLTRLKALDVEQTAVTAAGIKDFQAALPDCKILWKPPAE